MDQTVFLEDPGVFLQETFASKPMLGPAVFDLRVGERDPDLVHLVRSETPVDQLDLRAQKAGVGHPFLSNGLGTPPQTGPLDVHPDEILFRMAPRQSDGIFPLATAQLQDNGMVVAEKFLPPMPPQRKISFEQVLPRRLQQPRESLVLLKTF